MAVDSDSGPVLSLLLSIQLSSLVFHRLDACFGWLGHSAGFMWSGGIMLIINVIEVCMIEGLLIRNANRNVIRSVIWSVNSKWSLYYVHLKHRLCFLSHTC